MKERDEASEELNTAKEEEQVFGERLLDDLMNTFCDSLQRTTCEIEGFLAIQYILASRPISSFWEWLCCRKPIGTEEVRKHISGTKPVLQIIYDADRVHYVVLYFDPRKKTVTLYDSLIDEDIENVMTTQVCSQIYALFGHLYPDSVILLNVEMNFERQQDDWSCGYRAVACVTDLARGRDPAGQTYNLQLIYAFLLTVLCKPKKISWELFKGAVIAKIPQESRSTRGLRFFSYALSLAAAAFTTRSPREDDSSKMKVKLRADGSYSVEEGFEKIRKASRKRSETTTSHVTDEERRSSAFTKPSEESVNERSERSHRKREINTVSSEADTCEEDARRRSAGSSTEETRATEKTTYSCGSATTSTVESETGSCSCSTATDWHNDSKWSE